MSGPLGKDIGHGIIAKTFGIPEETVAGVRLVHKDKEGHHCSLVLNFDTARMRRVSPDTPKFTVLRLLPLTIQEKITCRRCGLTGYITNGIWEFA